MISRGGRLAISRWLSLRRERGEVVEKGELCLNAAWLNVGHTGIEEIKQ